MTTVHGHTEFATRSCPVDQCENCGCSIFEFHLGTWYTREGYECAECGAFYDTDDYIRGPAPDQPSDACTGL